MVRTMSNNANPQNVQPERPTRSRLSNGYEFVLAGGYWCLECGTSLHAIYAEPTGEDGAMRLLCRDCGHLILQYELRL